LQWLSQVDKSGKLNRTLNPTLIICLLSLSFFLSLFSWFYAHSFPPSPFPFLHLSLSPSLPIAVALAGGQVLFGELNRTLVYWTVMSMWACLFKALGF